MQFIDEDLMRQRYDFVEQASVWAKDCLPVAALDAAFESLPIGMEVGWVVVWMPFNEGDFEARWCMTRIGVLWALHKARRARSLINFVLDADLTSQEAWTAHRG